MKLSDLRSSINPRTFDTYKRADDFCADIKANAQSFFDDYLKSKSIAADSVCIVAVGSVGRVEALEASDLDIIPVFRDAESLKSYEPFDKEMRDLLSKQFGKKVSQGSDLTKCNSVGELFSPESIGGKTDGSGALTRRVLILTEGMQIGGAFPIDQLRKSGVSAYAAQSTSGRHLLSLGNDLARYYRTLCVEYVAKVDVEGKDWCTRNLKLRHSRKFWYFSTMLAMAHRAQRALVGGNAYHDEVVAALGLPPFLRLADATREANGAVLGKILEIYAYFLEFMSDENRRKSLAKVTHDKRHDPSLENPFPGLKANSDVLHGEMLRMLSYLPPSTRDSILSWFLL